MYGVWAAVLVGLAAGRLSGQSQLKTLYGDQNLLVSGEHAGNQFRTTFYNDGTWGINRNSTSDIGGEWPIGSGHIYMLDGNPFVGSEVIDEEGQLRHITSTVRSAASAPESENSSGDGSPDGQYWWTFLPVRGFYNEAPPAEMSRTPRIAMSKWKWSWPSFWPDKSDDPVDAGWANDATDGIPTRAAWNGYFGKDQFNADEESYYVGDDSQNKEWKFYPDPTDRSRQGLGLRMYGRGLQWSNALVENALFILYDFENYSPHHHDKMVFGFKIGNNLGDTMSGQQDGADDCGAYELDTDIAYMYDFDNLGGGGYTPVALIGGAFLESPGNPYDGIDNDGDGINGSGGVINEAMFAERTLRAGETIVKIDYLTFERTVMPMPDDTLRIAYQNIEYKFWPGKVVAEYPQNLIDDNLNGIIDENDGSVFGTEPNQIVRFLYANPGVKYINYITGEGKDNLMIDERRDDGIDNDGDWIAKDDDNGQDGAPSTGDPGEKDGRPTNGEPHFEKTDISETDMIGLTSFNLYEWSTIPQYDDEGVWDMLRPGMLDDRLQRQNTEIMWGSGYFPMEPGTFQRFSMGVVLADGPTLDEGRAEMVYNTGWVTKAYEENYNFSKAPAIPTVWATAGNRKVTLNWDNLAEHSVDPILGEDFEGYRIYRSTDPGWNDCTPVTDSYGSTTYRRPVKQFDIDNEFSGLSPVPLKGVCFDLGENTGLRHTWTDTTVKNGQKYYYAVTAYDHGDPESGIAPSECPKFIAISTGGEISKGTNVVIVTPEAPSAGFLPSQIATLRNLAGSTATGSVSFSIVEPTNILDGHTYRFTFEDTMRTITNLAPNTKSFTLTDVTDPSAPRLLVDRSRNLSDLDESPTIDGFKFAFFNEAELILDTERSAWSRPGLHNYTFAPYRWTRITTVPVPADYRIEFGADSVGQSTRFMRGTTELVSKPVNFRVYKMIPSDTGEIKTEIQFAFYEQDGSDGRFSAFSNPRRLRTDQIITMNDTGAVGFLFQLDATTYDSTLTSPSPGDYITLRLDKPFLSHDVVEFTVKKESIDDAAAKEQLKNVKVVPNPYIISNSWEPPNPYTSGRGPRELHFIHLPALFTIKIFNVRGQLVQTIEHNTPAIADGTEIWDMRSRDNLDIAYGVYIFYVDAGSIGQKVGKFAIVK